MNEVLPKGLLILHPNVFGDDRGYFFESYNKKRMETVDVNDNFVQDNESCSCKNVLRGLHYQLNPCAQSKLVRVVKGEVIDFVLDIRRSSDTFGKMYFVYLSSDNKTQFYVPHGFAHGFISLADDTIFAYKCDNYYSKDCERGISLFDNSLKIFDNLNLFANRSLGINLDFNDIITSDKDKKHPDFKNAECFN